MTPVTPVRSVKQNFFFLLTQEIICPTVIGVEVVVGVAMLVVRGKTAIEQGLKKKYTMTLLRKVVT